MPFFRLGKIDKGEKPDKDEAGASAAPAASSAVPSAASGGAPAAMEGPAPAAKERPEKKKKQKDLSGDPAPASAANSAAVGSVGGGLAAPSGSMRGGGAGGGAGLSVNDFISKTKNQQRQGLKPSGPELIAYARYLGIDPVADHDLLWIAVEALEAPLPSDWTEHFDSNERVFYYNATMRVSSWTHPLEHKYRDTYKQIVNFRNANLSAPDRAEKLHDLQMEVKQMEHDVHKEIAQWTEHTDEQGNRFYFNREERQSTWTDPRPAKCQVLYLRMKMLRLLQTGSGSISAFHEAKGGMEVGHGGHGSHGGHNSQGGPASRFVPLGHFEAERVEPDPAHKRPKVSAGRPAEGGLGGNEDDGGVGGGRHGAELMSEPEPSSGSESDDEGKRRKKKKKKKKKKHKHDADGAAPPRPGGAQMHASKSEPAVGSSPSGPQGLQPLGFDHAESGHGVREGLNAVGRTHVKPGIRLEPLAPIAGPGAGGQLAPLERRGPQASASVPAL